MCIPAATPPYAALGMGFFGLLASAMALSPDFKAQVIDDKIQIGYGLAIADLSGDGKADIFLADAKDIVCYEGPEWKKSVLASRLTARDNVCLAAADVDGDGKAEIAVGANWNPANTSDAKQSGSVHFLMPNSATEWSPVNLPHQPTLHRMRWVGCGGGNHALVTLPLHGRDNKNGIGEHFSLCEAHLAPSAPQRSEPEKWTRSTVDQSLHITHNFDQRNVGDADQLLLGGKEGILVAEPENGGKNWKTRRLSLIEPEDEDEPSPPFPGVGEIRFWNTGKDASRFDFATVEPFHGNMLVVYRQKPDSSAWQREILTEDLNQGHALACGDLLGLKSEQIVVGWREPNEERKVGIKIFWQENTVWKSQWIANNTMACEDLKLTDLDADGDLDIIAAGRATKNVVIYWNQRKP